MLKPVLKPKIMLPVLKRKCYNTGFKTEIGNLRDLNTCFKTEIEKLLN